MKKESITKQMQPWSSLDPWREQKELLLLLNSPITKISLENMQSPSMTFLSQTQESIILFSKIKCLMLNPE